MRNGIKAPARSFSIQEQRDGTCIVTVCEGKQFVAAEIKKDKDEARAWGHYKCGTAKPLEAHNGEDEAWAEHEKTKVVFYPPGPFEFYNKLLRRNFQ